MSKPLFLVAMDAARTVRPKLTPADKLVLAYLAYRQGRNSYTWPSVKTIGADLGISQDTVDRATANLAEAGLLTKTSGRPGRGHASRYSVLLPKAPAPQDFNEPENSRSSGLLEGDKTPDSAEENSRSSGENSSRSIQSKRARKRFTPPTLAEVRAYATSRGYPGFDAQRFVDFYAANNWKDSKGNPVRSWKQKYLSTWEPKLTKTAEPEPGTREATDEEAEQHRRAMGWN